MPTLRSDGSYPGPLQVGRSPPGSDATFGDLAIGPDGGAAGIAMLSELGALQRSRIDVARLISGDTRLGELDKTGHGPTMHNAAKIEVPASVCDAGAIVPAQWSSMKSILSVKGERRRLCA